MDFSMHHRLLPGMKPRPSIILEDKQNLNEMIKCQSNATFIFIKNCVNYGLKIEGKAAKIMCENCNFVELEIETSLISGTLELLRSKSVTTHILDSCEQIPIVHIDECESIKMKIHLESQLKSIYFQKTKDIKVNLNKDGIENELVVDTLVQAELHDVDEIPQWVAHWNKNMSGFVTERVVRSGIYLSQAQMQAKDKS